jgi:hypothetical protein
MKPIRRPGREALAFVRAQAAAQRRRCRQLGAALAALAPRRARWLAEFRARLEARGVDAGGERRRVPAEALPARAPRRAQPVPRATGRPHLERSRDRASPWQRLALPGFPRGALARVLSLDPASGATSLQLRLPRGTVLPGGWSESDLELLVLDGAVAIGAAGHGPGSYLYVPRGVALPPLSSPRGATLLAFYADGPPSLVASDSDHPRAERDRLVSLDAYDGLAWDAAGDYPPAAAGRLVKRLRVDAASRALTCLVALAPHFRRDAVVFHDCAVETYQISGDCWSLQAGATPPGSYAWRAPYVNGGPYASVRGALLLVRTDGELVAHAHLDPWTTPAANRAAALAAFKRARPHLGAPRARRGRAAG